jgi:hypothetical protein
MSESAVTEKKKYTPDLQFFSLFNISLPDETMMQTETKGEEIRSQLFIPRSQGNGRCNLACYSTVH